MSRHTLIAIVMGTGLYAGAAFADDDCRAPMSSWKPREAVEAEALSMGWQVRRVRTDDGCYQVYARDSHGNDIVAKFDPATLNVRTIEVEFATGSGLADLCSITCRSPARAVDPGTPGTPGGPRNPLIGLPSAVTE